jgi:hypothetical protein
VVDAPAVRSGLCELISTIRGGNPSLASVDLGTAETAMLWGPVATPGGSLVRDGFVLVDSATLIALGCR